MELSTVCSVCLTLMEINFKSNKKSLLIVAEDVNAVVKGTVSTEVKDGLQHLHVDTLSFDMQVKNLRMAVKNIFKNNRILSKSLSCH